LKVEKEAFSLKEEQVVECCSLLDNIFLQDNVANTWIWKHDPHEGYLIKGVYHLLTHDEQQVRAPLTNIICNKVVPLKVSFFT